MKRVLTIILIVALQSVVAAQAGSDATGWKKNGENIVQSSAMKAKNGFGAQIWLIDDEQFFTDWEKPTAGVRIKPVSHATRDKPIFAVIVFTGSVAGSNGLCNVTGDIIVRKPDGKKYGEITDSNFWQKLPPPRSGQLQLGVSYLGIAIEKKDPSGKYTAEATVVDKITGTALTLNTEFLVD